MVQVDGWVGVVEVVDEVMVIDEVEVIDEVMVAEVVRVVKMQILHWIPRKTNCLKKSLRSHAT